MTNSTMAEQSGFLGRGNIRNGPYLMEKEGKGSPETEAGAGYREAQRIEIPRKSNLRCETGLGGE